MLPGKHHRGFDQTLACTVRVAATTTSQRRTRRVRTQHGGDICIGDISWVVTSIGISDLVNTHHPRHVDPSAALGAREGAGGRCDTYGADRNAHGFGSRGSVVEVA
jgi:hypothetical protein